MLIQLAGGPELLVMLLMFLVMGVVPFLVTAVAIYLLYRIRQDTKAMAASLERLATDESSAAIEPEHGNGADNRRDPEAE